jgi:hypothetical protein
MQSSLSVEDWDPRGDYKEVVEAVKKSGKGDVTVYRTSRGTRTDYYVVVNNGKGALVGVMATGIES